MVASSSKGDGGNSESHYQIWFIEIAKGHSQFFFILRENGLKCRVGGGASGGCPGCGGGKDKPPKYFWFTGSFDVLQLSFSMENPKERKSIWPDAGPTATRGAAVPRRFAAVSSSPALIRTLRMMLPPRRLVRDMALVLFCTESPKTWCFSGICVSSCVPIIPETLIHHTLTLDFIFAKWKHMGEIRLSPSSQILRLPHLLLAFKMPQKNRNLAFTRSCCEARWCLGLWNYFKRSPPTGWNTSNSLLGEEHSSWYS